MFTRNRNLQKDENTPSEHDYEDTIKPQQVKAKPQDEDVQHVPTNKPSSSKPTSTHTNRPSKGKDLEPMIDKIYETVPHDLSQKSDNSKDSQGVNIEAEDKGIQDVTNQEASPTEPTSTCTDRSSNRKDVSLIDKTYEPVPHDLGEKSDNSKDSSGDITLKMYDECKEVHYTPLTTYESIGRSTKDKEQVNVYEKLKK